ncbi:MAG: OmpA family protein [Neomegalonema sp.]|nr:OmpA family protein [Neomegalonema sp.]
MSDERPIVIKKVKKVVGGGHHGGAWKVAYADFVTAMMAFFLLMWLLNAVSADTKKGLADFFNDRIPMTDESAGGQGMLNGESIVTDDDMLGQGAAQQMAPGGAQASEEPIDTADVNELQRDVEANIGEGGDDAAFGPEDGAEDLQTAFEAMKAALDEDNSLEAARAADLIKHITLKMTPEGLVIEIADRDGASLFRKASAEPVGKLRDIIEMLTPIIASVKNRIAITGHTDIVPFAAGANYGNWELSSDRANAARRLMLGAGLPTSRLRKVVGAAATDPIDEDPAAAVNRRIAITLLRGDRDES